MDFCIHGHFYQPPREDPISGYVPAEKGAEPYRNWNERILMECYQPNARFDNFSKISFNLGPTLMNWMSEAFPNVLAEIVRQENARFHEEGVGNGMAQAYNHSILPLLSLRDKVTQVRWGLEDFKFRFSHAPEGMWLPEAAVDVETLAVLADAGLRFTILAPWQLHDMAPEGGPCFVELPGGREPFVVFAYDRGLSTGISFQAEMTENGDRFLQILKARETMAEGLCLMASDGELYGHHQVFRDHFLRYVVHEGAEKADLHWTYPGLWLRDHRVNHKATLVAPSSWSCMHGVDRWARDCACTPRASWKEPLRTALQSIRDFIDEVYLEFSSPFCPNPWEMRHDYMSLYHGLLSLDAFVEKHCSPCPGSEMREKLALLLQAQYEGQRIFTSCGWFFDEFHRIEPQNNIAYAANAVWLTQLATGREPDSAFLEELRAVKSEKTGLRADTVYSQTLLRARAERKE